MYDHDSVYDVTHEEQPQSPLMIAVQNVSVDCIRLLCNVENFRIGMVALDILQQAMTHRYPSRKETETLNILLDAVFMHEEITDATNVGYYESLVKLMKPGLNEQFLSIMRRFLRKSKQSWQPQYEKYHKIKQIQFNNGQCIECLKVINVDGQSDKIDCCLVCDYVLCDQCSGNGY